MSTSDRILDIVAGCIELQSRIAARKVDRMVTLLTLKVAAGLLVLAALGVLLTAMYVALATVIHSAAALALVGLTIAVIAGLIIVVTMTVSHSD